MALRDTLREMFEPATYPAPRLDAVSLAWRYAIALTAYLWIGLGVVLGSELSPLRSLASADGQIEITTDWPREMPAWLAVTDLALGLVGLVLVHWRRRWPLGLYLVLETLGLWSTTVSIAGLWVLFTLTGRRDLRKVVIAVAYSLAMQLAMLVAPWRAGDFPQPVPLFATGAVLMVVVVLLGLYRGVRIDRTAGVLYRAENADRDREFAVLAERNRIAREMHDVLAHRISLVSMHAGALAYRSDLPAAQTREIAQVIQENAHASLTELRSVLSNLREGELQMDAAGPVPPQPALSQLDDLLGEARRLGQRVEVERAIDADALPPVTSRHMYRIIQEALTNARKHAPYAPVRLALTGSPDAGVHVRVANPITTVAGGVPGAKLGLVGVTERAQMLGGTAQAGPEQGDFVVDVRVPWTR